MDIHQELKELSKFLSEYSTSLMAVGVQTSRIVRNTARIAESFGFLCDMTIFQKTIIMTLRDADNSHSYSTVNKIKPMGLNFAINSKLSTLATPLSGHCQQATREQMAGTNPCCICQCILLPLVSGRLYFDGNCICSHSGRFLCPYPTDGTSLEPSGGIYNLRFRGFNDWQYRLSDALGQYSRYGTGYKCSLPYSGGAID